MIKLDNKYSLRNNSIHGVELVFEEQRQRKDKEGKLKDYIFTDIWYYPNPVLAVKKWIELTSKQVENLDQLIKHTEEINQTLDKIYSEFVSKGRVL